MELQHLAQKKTKLNQIVILTLAEFDNNFPKNFSSWCAGALEAKGYKTHLTTLDWIKDVAQKPPSMAEALKSMLLSASKIVFVFPEWKGMLPINVKKLTKLFPLLPKYETVTLITIAIDSVNQVIDAQVKELFVYPIHALDTILGLNLSENQTQIQNSIDGSMCALFKENYRDLASIIEKIVQKTT